MPNPKGPFLLGLDIGSSSVKASLLDASTGTSVASASSPDKELEITAPKQGWAEQHPDTWWEHVRKATAKVVAEAGPAAAEGVKAVGISYQMHGLVVVDKALKPLRNAIIWCDSRAVGIGERACESLGRKQCLERLLNSPGNFTASKLRWVKENEPELYAKVHRMMLPGDYVALVMTGELCTTPSGLSEGILWDYKDAGPAAMVLDHYGISEELLPECKPTFSVQGTLLPEAASALKLKAGIPVAYRAGDQPNNAFSLNVLEPGEVAATAGTSGVVYGVIDKPLYDEQSRVNTFVHVNHAKKRPRYGMLLCVNGTGILNSWLRHNFGAAGMSYEAMNALAGSVPPGSAGLVVLPFGNGAERTLGNRNLGAAVCNLQLTVHTQAHLLRAAQEGIVFALAYGLGIMREAGVEVSTVRAGHANMFLSPVFCEAFASVTGATVELYNTDGAQGAARGAGIGAGVFGGPAEAFAGLKAVKTVGPSGLAKDSYDDAYRNWLETLAARLDEESA